MGVTLPCFRKSLTHFKIDRCWENVSAANERCWILHCTIATKLPVSYYTMGRSAIFYDVPSQPQSISNLVVFAPSSCIITVFMEIYFINAIEKCLKINRCNFITYWTVLFLYKRIYAINNDSMQSVLIVCYIYAFLWLTVECWYESWNTRMIRNNNLNLLNRIPDWRNIIIWLFSCPAFK